MLPDPGSWYAKCGVRVYGDHVHQPVKPTVGFAKRDPRKMSDDDRSDMLLLIGRNTSRAPTASAVLERQLSKAAQ